MRNFPLIAREGWFFIAVTTVLTLASARMGSLESAAVFAVLTTMLILLFRDPARPVPSCPLGIIAPVDGRILSIEPTDKWPLEGEAIRITIRINRAGAYSVRSPSEGKVLNLKDNLSAGSNLTGKGGLWVRTDEGHDVLLMMRGPGWLGRPVAFVGYGQRLGQGQRCAFIRLASHADVYVPVRTQPSVGVGDRVLSGESVLGMLAT